MSIATELERIIQAKADIKSAIEGKGVTVPSSATIDSFNTYVEEIPSGGGSSADTEALKGLIQRDMTSIVIPDSVTSIGNYAFYGCNSLTSIVIPDGVTSIGNYAFLECTGLTSCTIGSGVTSIGEGAFLECTGLTSCTIGSGVTSIGGAAFTYCESLTSIVIPNSVTSIGDGTFEGCSSLTSCTIGSGVTSIGDYAFQDCTSLTSITIQAKKPPTLSNINAFNNTNNCPIYVPSGSVAAYKAATNWSSLSSRIQAIP